jgi:hypothetical protein
MTERVGKLLLVRMVSAAFVVLAVMGGRARNGF